MKKFVLEVCCGCVEDVVNAYEGGADRVELNSCLFHGGLTPSVGELIVAKKLVPIPIIKMVRPRQGGFCYTDLEYKTALADAEQLVANGSDGLVFGFLNSDGTLDVERNRELCAIAGNLPKVFHRAIDVASDWKKMLGQLIDLGFTRVLTSGLAPDVFYGIDTVREMIEFAQGAIQIMPGAGVCLQNIDKIVEHTGCKTIHVARFAPRYDNSVANNRDIFYGGALYPPEDRYEVVDTGYISQIRTHG